jgi:NADH:ubiquinone oxidoreductase subunit E
MDRIEVTICAGTTCVVMGGSHLLLLEEHLPPHLRGRVSVRGARCLECCHQSRPDDAPYVRIDGEILGGATLPGILERLEALAARKG